MFSLGLLFCGRGGLDGLELGLCTGSGFCKIGRAGLGRYNCGLGLFGGCGTGYIGLDIGLDIGVLVIEGKDGNLVEEIIGLEYFLIMATQSLCFLGILYFYIFWS